MVVSKHAAVLVAACVMLVTLAACRDSAAVKVFNDLPVTLSGAFCSNDSCTRFHRTYGPLPSGEESVGYYRQVYGIPHRYLFEGPDGTRRCLVLNYKHPDEVPAEAILVSEIPLCGTGRT